MTTVSASQCDASESEPQYRQRLLAGLRLLRKHPVMAVGLVLIALLLSATAAPQLIAPDNPLAMNLADRLHGPSMAHILGTDEFGRDMFSRVIFGARISLAIAAVVVFSSSVIGLIVGMASALAGGWVDEVVMRFTDVFLAFPNILLAMVVVVTLKPGLTATAIALGAVWWAPYARLVRGQVLAIKEYPYVESGRAIGAGPMRLIRRYIWPSAAPPFVVMATMDMGFVMLAAAGLGFLGLGAQRPTPEWGTMVSDGLAYFLQAWWYPVFPGIAIGLAVLAFNLLGDGLQELLGKSQPRV